MNIEESKLALKAAILEWQKKQGVADNDPMLAQLQLWEVYFNNTRLQSSKESIPSFGEFRSSLEQMERLSQGFSKQTAELIQEIRAVPKLRSDLNSFPHFALVLTALGALVTGILIGKFIF